MTQVDLTTAISRLLSDRSLRENFARSPRLAAETIGVAPSDLGSFVQIDCDGLCRQAQAMIDKRRYEVAKLLPETFAGIGSEGEELFNFYAQTFWPTGHRRHAIDARQFLQFLLSNGIAGARKPEWRRLSRQLS